MPIAIIKKIIKVCSVFFSEFALNTSKGINLIFHFILQVFLYSPTFPKKTDLILR